MKRKMLISMALVIIMLLNCIMPVLVSNAGTTGEEIQLNSKLYFAVKATLVNQKISHTADDITHTITISAANLATVKRLNLKEGGISDLTNIGAFTEVEHLDLSGNNLTEESNLAALNGLTKLSYLDLSTNKIADVSAIDELINLIEAKPDGKVVLSGQTVTQVSEAIINEEEDSNNEMTMTVTLPQILEKAGFIKAHWMEQGTYYESDESLAIGVPTLERMSNPVTPTNNALTVNIANEAGEGYYGLYQLLIYIHDDQTEAASAANLNPAATNQLNGSRFYIYVCVHGSSTTAINTPDTNLYNAIKEQLTAGQTINPELESYPYSTDSTGETIYESCTYAPCTVSNGDADGEYYVLTPEGFSVPQYIWDKTTGYVYEIESSTEETDPTTGETTTVYTIGEVYSNQATVENSEEVDPYGVVTTRKVIRFPHNGENRNLYVKAYDVAKIFVIDNEDLYNKITSLILNNREIRDLTGIEKFVGLKSYLNVSHNYLDNIDPIYELQANKDEKETVLRTNFKKWFSEREYGNLKDSYDVTHDAKEDVDKCLEELSNAYKQLYKLVKEASEIKPTKEDGTPNEQFAEQCAKKAEDINKQIDKIEGYWDTNEATGESKYVEGILDKLYKAIDTLNSNVGGVYHYLQILYGIYNNDYRLATLLVDEINYLDIEEYEALQSTYKSTKDNVEKLFKDQVDKLSDLDEEEALSDLDRDLLNEAFAVPYPSIVTPKPVSERFDAMLDNNAYNRVEFVRMCETMREIGLLSEISNYCLMKRMNQETAAIQCYAEDYLKARIEEFSYEGIDVKLEEKILDNLQNGVAEDPNGDTLYDIFYNWIHYAEVVDPDTGDLSYTGAYMYGTLPVPRCQGEYKRFDRLDITHDNITTDAQLAQRAGVSATAEGFVETMSHVQAYSLPVQCKLVEYFNGQQGEVQLYTELMAFAGKMVDNESKIDRYITLPDLKKLDISYNAYLTGIERLGELQGLRELYAGYDYITDLSETDWEALKYLRVLDFSYNYIRSITPLEVLDHLQVLNVSHNLLSGALNYNLTNVQDTLQYLDLSYNQLEDITTLLEYIDLKSWGDDGNYLAREDTLNVDLSYQTINMEVEEPIYLSEYPETVDIELPKIFTQLLAIDVNRTGLGLQSSEGRIESEGKYVTLVTRTPGDKVGTVVVLPMNGGGWQPDTCIGNGSKAVIKYKVAQRTVNEITISPELISMDKGATQQFTAEVTGENLKDTSVTWAIEGNSSENTKIDENGLLTIGADETAASIKVIVISNFDTSMTDYTTVKVNGNEAPDPEDGELTVSVSPESCNVKVGETKVFTATVTGNNVTDTTVTWTVTGANSANTKIVNGTLTVGTDETATTLTVTATSNADNTKSDTATVSVKPADYSENQNIQVSVTPSSATVEPGKTQKFVATVTGDNVTDSTVTWSVSGNRSSNTKIANDGTLTIGTDETAKTLTITARSNADGEKVKTVTVTVPGGSSSEYPVINLGYETEDEFLKEIKPKTPVSDFKTILIGNQPYNVVVKKDGQTITSGNMKTGMYVQIQDQNGEVVHQGPNSLYVYEVVVKGDVNSDGVANSLDSVAIKAHRNEVRGAMLTGSAFEAGDINDDGTISPIDSKLLLYHRAEVKGYVLDYVK